MTPEEIVNKIINSSKQDFGRADGIEAIHQYAKDFAKQMCDKQKQECTKVGYAMDAPYPKELI
jgi:hypothetical protein